MTPRSRSPLRHGLPTALAVGLLAATLPAHAEVYTATLLGTLGGPTSHAAALNNVGQIVGDAHTATGLRHAFLYANGVMTDLGTLPGGTYSWASGINLSGQIVGHSEVQVGPDVMAHATRWFGGTVTDIGMQAGRFNAASGINDAGAIAGTMASGNIYPNAARWDGDVVTNLATTPTQYSTAVAINASGQIVGEQADPDPFAYLWNGTVPTALPSIGNGGMSDGMAINAAGQIAGFARPLDGSPGSHAMRWSGNGAPRVATDLGTLGGQNSGAWGINAAAQMVGYAETAGRVRHAALWTNGVVVDLNTALSPAEAAYVTLTMAYAINDHGWIVADGDDTRNPLTPVAYLLTPAMPPCRWDRGSRDAEHGKREHTRPSRERTDRHQMAPDAELGMTPHEVRQSAWGAPVSVNVATHHNQTSELWWYRDNRHLQFANGCLRAIHTERGR